MRRTELSIFDKCYISGFEFFKNSLIELGLITVSSDACVSASESNWTGFTETGYFVKRVSTNVSRIKI